MSTTDELLRLLDERGEDYVSDQHSVTWAYYTDPHTATESMDGTLIVTGLTPEQAIAATLGERKDRTEEWLLNACNNAANDYIAELERKLEAATLGCWKLTAEQVRRCVRVGACDHGLWEAIDEDTDWQAIADELNATLGSRTCEVVQGKNGLECSKCGKELPYDPFADYECNFCPTCGAQLRYGRR